MEYDSNGVAIVKWGVYRVVRNLGQVQGVLVRRCGDKLEAVGYKAYLDAEEAMTGGTEMYVVQAIDLPPVKPTRPPNTAEIFGKKKRK